MRSRSALVMNAALRVLHPLVRLLLRHGVTYPVFSAAIKRVFLDAAQAELAARHMPATDSAITLLSGVHRRDVRNLTRSAAETDPDTASAVDEPLGLVGQVVARWLSDPACIDAAGAPQRLPRSGSGAMSFDALVASVSRDVRPRAMLDEMLRLGVVAEHDDGVALVTAGFAPRQGLAETLALAADNLHDHAAAVAANLNDERNFLEQAVYVDEITPESASVLQDAAVQAWRAAFRSVMQQAQERFDHDATAVPPAERRHRARFGVYFFSDHQD